MDRRRRRKCRNKWRNGGGDWARKRDHEMAEHRHRAGPVHAYGLEQLVREAVGLEQAHERQSRVQARDDDVGRQLVAVFQHHSLGLVGADSNACDLHLRADLDASGARRTGDRVRDRTGPAALQSPGAECAVDLSHVVMEQHVRRSRRSHAQKRPDDA